MNFRLIASLLFFSLPFWVGNPGNPAGWSFVEGIAGGLTLELLSRKDEILLPSFRARCLFLCVLLWSAASFFWTRNFHSTLTGIYKIAFCGMAEVLFLNDRQEWELAVGKSLRIMAVLGAVSWIVFRSGALSLLSGWIKYPNLYAGFLSLCGVFAASAFLREGSRGEKWAGFTAILTGTAVFLSGSLGAVLAWTGGIAALLVARGSRPASSPTRNSRIIIYGLGLLVVLSLVPYPRNYFSDFWARRWTDRYASERLAVWKDSVRMFLAHPIRGAGLGNFREIYPQFKSIPGLRNAPYAHNELLNVLCEMGLAGTLILGLLGVELFKRGKNILTDETARPWAAVVFAALVQSLADFNLRYEPIAILCVFALARLLPEGDALTLAPLRRRALLTGAALASFLFLLPGAAFVLYRIDPQNAALAKNIDPLNGFYWSQTGRMRDLEVAISLEPGNVWFRREAAQFYARDWQKTGNRESLENARKEYDFIQKTAPNVAQFQTEMEALK